MNPVEQLKQEYESIVMFLTESNQISLLSDYNKSFRKVLLLSAGSYFEYAITSILSDFVSKQSNGDLRIITFLQKQAISGRYHQLFDWGKQDQPESYGDNANKFWSYFGNDFKQNVSADVKKNKEIAKSIEAFIQVGHLRNILVHSNFAAYDYDQKTTEEIYLLFKDAEPFLDYLRDKLN